jgi:hypothetical protein
MDDISDYINQATSQGKEVILTGDMNIPVFSDEACTFLGSCGLVDLLESFIGMPAIPETAAGSV